MPNLQHWMFLTGVCSTLAVATCSIGCGSDGGAESTGDGGTDTGGAFDATGFDTSALLDTAKSDTATSETPSDTPATCSPSGDADPGSICPAGKWRDFEGATCDNCPASPLVCETSFDPTGVTFDTTTKILDVHLRVAKTQLFSGKVSITYTKTSSCFADGPSSGATVSTAELPIVPLNDHFTVDLSSLGTDAVPCGIQTLTATDACCSTQTVKIIANRDGEGGRMVVSCPALGDGGTDGSSGG
jgi:hypothetical protein